MVMSPGRDEYERQLRMARFAMHRVRIAQYAGLSRDEAMRKYREAMENFDHLMELAASEPERLESCEADMAKGFHL
jgi:hypothetical protein